MKVDFETPIDALPPAEQASIMAEVERAITAIKACGPNPTSDELMAAYENLRPTHNGELVYVLDEGGDIA